MITLTKEEKIKFIKYARMQEFSAAGIAKQMEKASMPDAVIKREKLTQGAFKYVADYLEKQESTTL